MQLHEFNNPEELNQSMSADIGRILTQAIEQRGHAYLVVSGGKTPIALFQCLSQLPIPWENITITLADERCVGLDTIERNEALVRNYLMQARARKAQFLSLYDQKASETEDLSHIECSVFALPTFDVVILGMGGDGHTASLFPCSQELGKGLADDAPAVLFVNPKTAPYKRISLSKSRLSNTHHLYLHLIGTNKRSVLTKAMNGEDEFEMPIRAFLHNADLPVQVMYAPS